jgi:hypothetical protein
MWSMILLTAIINPWPPRNFGFLVDSQTLSTNYGISKEAFSMISTAIFDQGIMNSSQLDPEVNER